MTIEAGSMMDKVRKLFARDGDARYFAVSKPAGAWREALTPEQYRVLREHGTERPGSSRLLAEKRSGTYRCAGCGAAVYSADTKFESGTGWPSFTAAVGDNVATATDRGLLMSRMEVHCANCGGHPGHRFADGPAPTGMRYCINGCALTFEPA